MKLSDFSIQELAKIIIGDTYDCKYLRLIDILELFNCFGERDYLKDGKIISKNATYDKYRYPYCVDKLKNINEKRALEDMLLRVITTNNAIEIDDLIVKINKIIMPDGYSIEKVGDKYLIDSDYSTEDMPQVSLSFEQIKSDIIENLKNAKLCIWAAIAWLTDKDILNTLYTKQKEGIDIQIMVYDDIEKEAKGLLPDYDKHFKNVYRIPAEMVDKGYYIRKDKMMHLKLFIIDLELVAMGSYNWTDQATRNYEGILTVKHRKTAYEAALEFVRIKGEFLKNKKQ
jgi:phosphatidylserine/phosphatidylglycerophosphate/cardiolipin synthase-like enzyme